MLPKKIARLRGITQHNFKWREDNSFTRVECRCATPLSVITMAIIEFILVMTMDVMYANVVDGGRYWLWVEGLVASFTSTN